MRGSVVIDTGPLVALFDRDDQYHQPAIGFLRKLTRPLLTTWPVITEVAVLLDFSPLVQGDFLEWVRTGGVTVADLATADLARVRQLLRKYADLPMDFADASLVVVCERLSLCDVASIDQDFDRYRLHGRTPFTNLFPR